MNKQRWAELCEWHDWFAWFPVQAVSRTTECDEFVWFKTVKRRIYMSSFNWGAWWYIYETE